LYCCLRVGVSIRDLPTPTGQRAGGPPRPATEPL